MDTNDIISYLHNINQHQQSITNLLNGAKSRMEGMVVYIDRLEADREREIVGEVLSESSVEGESEWTLSAPPLTRGTLYLDGNLVDPANYEIDLATGVVTALITVPAGSRITADYTHRGPTADVLDIAQQLEGYSLLELQDLRSKYVTAVDWIGQNFGTS